MAGPLDIPVRLAFEWATPGGADRLRDVAEHADDVGHAWVELGRSMRRLADKFDALVKRDEVVAVQAQTDRPDPGIPEKRGTPSP